MFQKLRGIQGIKLGHIHGCSPEESVSCTQICTFAVQNGGALRCESPFLGVFKKHEVMALKDMV